MGFLSKSAGKRTRSIFIMIETELRDAEFAELEQVWEQAGRAGARSDVLRELVTGLVDAMGATHTSRIENIQITADKNCETFFVVFETTKLTDAEAAEFEAAAAEQLTKLGRRTSPR